MLICAVDFGCYYTKDWRGKKFRSTVRQDNPNSSILDNGSIEIEYNSEPYFIGGRANVDYNTNVNKSVYEHAKVLIATAIANNLILPENDVRLFTCIPVSQASAVNIQRYKTLLTTRENNLERVKYRNGREVSFRVTQVEVMPEGAAAFYNHPNSKRQLLMDLGGVTLNCVLFEYRKLIQCKTYNLGCLKLNSNIQQALNRDYQMHEDLLGVQYIIDEGLLCDPEGGNKLVQKEMESHANTIFKQVSMDFNLGTCEVLLTGGGFAGKFGPVMQKFIPHAVTSENAEFDNVNGLLKIAQKWWGDK